MLSCFIPQKDAFLDPKGLPLCLDWLICRKRMGNCKSSIHPWNICQKKIASHDKQVKATSGCANYREAGTQQAGQDGCNRRSGAQTCPRSSFCEILRVEEGDRERLAGSSPLLHILPLLQCVCASSTQQASSAPHCQEQPLIAIILSSSLKSTFIFLSLLFSAGAKNDGSWSRPVARPSPSQRARSAPPLKAVAKEASWERPGILLRLFDTCFLSMMV